MKKIIAFMFMLFYTFSAYNLCALQQWEEERFYITPITDDIFARMKGKSYKDNCTVPLENLRYIHILHKNLQGETIDGELVCNKAIAEKLLDIFKKLYEAEYPIEKMQLVDEYNADDELSMSDNNSSSFNYRTISGTNKISNHGLGLAIDINPLYNPYVKTKNGKVYVEPAGGVLYTDRTQKFDYKIEEDDLCCQLFLKNGFEWGGHWTGVKDYQHFEISFSN